MGVFFSWHTRKLAWGEHSLCESFLGHTRYRTFNEHTELNQILTKRKTLMKLSKTHENAEMDT